MRKEFNRRRKAFTHARLTPWQRFTISMLLLFSLCLGPATARQDERGIGVKSTGQTRTPSASQAKKGGARPELVLQTGYGITGATRLVFSPDGRLLATAALGDSRLKLWEVSTGRELRTLAGRPTASFKTPPIAFSRDSRLVAAGGGDNTISVWEVSTGREVASLAGPSGSLTTFVGVSLLAFDADGRTLVSVGDSIRTWDLAAGTELRTVELNVLGSDGVLAAAPAAAVGLSAGLALSPDGAQLASVAPHSGTAKVSFLETATGREARGANLSGVEDDSGLSQTALAFLSGGRVLVAGVDKGKLKLWDVGGKGGGPRVLDGAAGDNVSLAFSPDGSLVGAAAPASYTYRVWETATGRELSSFKVRGGETLGGAGFLAFAFSGDNRLIATGGFDARPALRETATGREVRELTGHSNMAYDVSFSADGTKLFSGGRTRWDLTTGTGLATSAGAQPVRSHPSPDGRLLATVQPGTLVVRVVEAATGRVLQQLAPAAGGAGSMVAQVVFSPDGRLLAITYAPDEAGRLRLEKEAAEDNQKLDEEALKRARKNPADLLKIYGAQASQQSADNIVNQIKVWDAGSGRELRTFTSAFGGDEVAFSRDGRLVAVLSGQGGITIHDVTTGAMLRSFGTSQAPDITSLMAGGNPTAALGSILNQAMSGMAAGTGRTINAVVFSPDGRLVAAGGVESKSNFDMSAVMGAAMSGRKKPLDAQKEIERALRQVKVETVGQIALYDATTGQAVTALKGHGKGVTKIAFSGDGRWLASAATDHTIRVWDMASRAPSLTLAGHAVGVNSLAFSPDGRLLAAAGDDGGTRLWDLRTGELLATLVSLFDGGDWLVITPDGLFDGSPRAWNQILWRYDGNTFDVAPIEWFFNEFYYPGLLSDLYAGKRPRAAADISQKERRQPQVKLALAGSPASPPPALTTRDVKVNIEVMDAEPDSATGQRAGARDLRLFRNGSLVKAWRGDVLKGQQTVTLEANLSLVAGENRLVAYAFNRDNVKSKDALLNLTGDAGLRRAGTLYVLAVGINEYANPQFNLRYAVADAREFGAEVARQQTRLGRFGRVEVVQLLDRDATKANLLDALRRLSAGRSAPSLKAGVAQSLERLQTAQPEDAVVIYFAGHGTAAGPRFYLIPHDLGYAGGRGAIDAAGLSELLAHGISDEEIENAIEGLDAGQLLLVIDACNSGQALEAEERRRGPMNSKGLAQLAYEKGMYVLTAAQSYQAALEAAQLGHGLLTYALVEEGLKAAAADGEPKDGTLFAREWFDYATVRVPQMQEEKMRGARALGLNIAFIEGEDKVSDPDRRHVQRPRVFYRRELEANPLIVSRKQ